MGQSLLVGHTTVPSKPHSGNTPRRSCTRLRTLIYCALLSVAFSKPREMPGRIRPSTRPALMTFYGIKSATWSYRLFQ